MTRKGGNLWNVLSKREAVVYAFFIVVVTVTLSWVAFRYFGLA